MTQNQLVVHRVELGAPAVSGALEGHLPRYLGGRMSLTQAKALKRLTLSLREGHARLESGRHVEDAAGAVRWLLERYQAEFEGVEGENKNA